MQLRAGVIECVKPASAMKPEVLLSATVAGANRSSPGLGVELGAAVGDNPTVMLTDSSRALGSATAPIESTGAMLDWVFSAGLFADMSSDA